MTKIKLTLMAVVAVIATIAAVGIATGSDFELSAKQPFDELRDKRTDNDKPIVTDASPAAENEFGVLADAQAAGSAEAREAIADVHPETLGIDPANAVLAQDVPATEDGKAYEVVVAPGNRGICSFVAVENGGSGGGCSSEQDTAAGKAMTAAGCLQNGLQLIGLVPDGVGQIRVTLRDGSTHDVAVVNNTFGYSTAAGDPESAVPDTVSFDRDGQTLTNPSGFTNPATC